MQNVGKIFGVACFGLIVVLFCGCASAYYSTETDPQIPYDKEKWLAIYLGEEPSIKDKKLGLLLGKLMAEEGFIVSGFNMMEVKTPCGVTFSQNISSTPYTGSYTTYNTTTSKTFIPGNFTGNGYSPGRTITTRTTTPQTHIYSGLIVKQNVGLSIFCENNGKRERVWFGFMSANVSEYEKHQEKAIKNLIRLIGKDFKGDIDIWDNDK